MGKDTRMKFTIEIDCTPQEGREFLGLPDVRPMQEAMMAEAEERMKAAVAAMDPDALMKMWFPGGAEGMEQLRKMFWSAFSGGDRTSG